MSLNIQRLLLGKQFLLGKKKKRRLDWLILMVSETDSRWWFSDGFSRHNVAVSHCCVFERVCARLCVRRRQRQRSSVSWRSASCQLVVQRRCWVSASSAAFSSRCPSRQKVKPAAVASVGICSDSRSALAKSRISHWSWRVKRELGSKQQPLGFRHFNAPEAWNWCSLRLWYMS